MSDKTQICSLPDGRQLSYCLSGAEDGKPLFTFHGLPGSRMESLMFDAAAKQHNIKIITPDRPGYGLSTRHPERTLHDWSKDMAYLADTLKLNEFAVIGVSGGAPCALSCAHYMPQRITSAGIVCGLAPLKGTGLMKQLHWYASLGFFLARRFPFVLKIFYGLPVLALAKISPALILNIIALVHGGIDRKVLLQSDTRRVLVKNIQEAFRQGTDGAIMDMNLYSRNWGFALEDIPVHFDVWHGDMDEIVPLSHGKYIHEHLPKSTFFTMKGQGHFSLPLTCAETILATMADN